MEFRVELPGIGIVSREVSSFDEVRRLKDLVKSALVARYSALDRCWKATAVKDLDKLRELLRELGKPELFDRVIEYLSRRADELCRGSEECYVAVKPGFIVDRDAWRISKQLRQEGSFVVFTPRELAQAIVAVAGSMKPEVVARVLKSFLSELKLVRGDPEKLRERVLEEATKGMEASVRLADDGFVEIRIPYQLDRYALYRIRDALKIEYREKKVDESTGRIETITRTVRVGTVEREPDGSVVIRVAPALLDYVIERLEKDVGIRIAVPRDLGLRFEEVRLSPSLEPLRPYQEEALEAWARNGCRGVIVLPTGAGKTHVALATIARLRVPTLILVHTDALVKQWARRIREKLGVEPGIVAGGVVDIKPITVATYQSAIRYIDRLWNRFGLLICDECHHEPAETFFGAVQRIAAPYRLGLTATPWRDDGNEHLIYASLGPIVYQKSLGDLVREGWLVPVIVETVGVPMPSDLREKVEELMEQQRELYMMGRGRKRRGTLTKIASLIMQNPEKVRAVIDIVKSHPNSKIIVFTNYVPQAEAIYEALRKELGADKVAIFHGQMTDRKAEENLERFRRGEARVLIVTQKGDEGIDIPDADIGIIVSGYSSPRQFIQRMGRLVRKDPRNPYKVAKLYIVYTETPYEEAKVSEWLSIINQIAPQDEMKRIAEEIRRKAREGMEEPRSARSRRSRAATRIPEQIIEKYIRVFGEIDPRASEILRNILRKTPRRLSERERRLLALIMLMENPSFGRDVGRASKHRARYVYTWLRNPSRKDLPGVDTPEMRSFIRRVKRYLARGDLRKALALALR